MLCATGTRITKVGAGNGQGWGLRWLGVGVAGVQWQFIM